MSKPYRAAGFWWFREGAYLGGPYGSHAQAEMCLSLFKIELAKPIAPPNPVHRDKEDGKWYFWDETWAHRHGPYDTQMEVDGAFHRYAKALESRPHEA